jgi:DNA-directed RNA polymerase subunit H (RpoH/RPB5)
VKKLSVNTANCSHGELVRIAKRSGFKIFEGKKHTKVEMATGEFVTMIPRHGILNRYTAKGILEDMNTRGAGITIV